MWIDQEELWTAVETLDLLLFKHKDKSSGLQRFITGSYYDHVGILIVENDQIFMLDATSTCGVRLLNWEDLLTKINSCSGVGFKKVMNKKDKEHIAFFEDNIDHLLSCPY